MPQPFDYSLNLPDPSKNFLEGVMVFQKLQALKQKMAADQAERDRAAMRQRAFSTLGPDSSFDDYQRVMNQFPDDTSALLDQWKAYDENKRNSLFRAGSQAWSQLNPDDKGFIDTTEAKKTLETWADGLENARDPVSAAQLREIAASFGADNGHAARNVIGAILATAEPERFGKLIEARTKWAESDTAEPYYKARADKERSEADKAASDASYADEQNEADLDWTRARSENNRSLSRRRDSLPPKVAKSETDTGPRSEIHPKGKKAPTATGPGGKKLMWNGKAWVPLR